MYPALTAVIKQINNIQMTFFADLRLFNKTAKPNPAFTNNPANIAPNDRLPWMNNSASNKLEAQFGINPTIAENNGVKYLFINKKEENLSSPTKPIMNPKARLMTKT